MKFSSVLIFLLNNKPLNVKKTAAYEVLVWVLEQNFGFCGRKTKEWTSLSNNPHVNGHKSIFISVLRILKLVEWFSQQYLLNGTAI